MLEVKEGILLDQEGNPILGPQATRKNLGFAFSLGPIAGAILLVLFLFAGFTLATTLGAVLLGIWLVRSLLTFLGLAGPRGGARRGGFPF